MKESGQVQDHLTFVEKINSVFLGTRDFRELAEQSVKLMTQELRDEGVLGTAMYRVHPQENRIYAYAFSSRSFDAVNKLFPRKFSELSLPITETSNLLVRTAVDRAEQDSDSVYDFSRPVLDRTTSNAIQRAIGLSHLISYPLRLKQGKVAGVVLFGVENKEISERQRILFETFRSQLELALENIIEFEQVVERYKRSIAKTLPAAHEQNIPTIRFTLRITPKQNKLLEQKSREKETDKASLIRSWIDEKA